MTEQDIGADGGEGGRGSTRSVDRALALLTFIVGSEQPPVLADCSRAAGLAISTAARLLRTLEARELVHRDGAGRYWPGPQMFWLGARVMRTLPVYELSADHLQALARDTGESAYLLVPEGKDRAVYLRQVESDSAIRHTSWLGQSIPLKGTATGLALLGETNSGGYATNRGAVEPDSATAAAPVRGVEGRVVAVLSVIAPAYRTDDDRLQELGRTVAEHAEALSAQLGASASTVDAALSSPQR